jgi:hypothetical protein
VWVGGNTSTIHTEVLIDLTDELRPG